METIKFLIQGSAEDPYKVTFNRFKNEITAFCSCPAGQNGQYCKHRINILKGVTEGIVSDNQNEVSIIISWLPETALEEAIKSENEACNELEKAKKVLSVARKNISLIMMSRPG